MNNYNLLCAVKASFMNLAFCFMMSYDETPGQTRDLSEWKFLFGDCVSVRTKFNSYGSVNDIADGPTLSGAL